ncbi:MAG: hypothetical protein B0D92_06845 [Spirochaeta sp. LUC14_002_19_P3]|nr:MAG: hypothetical protein B0D92_06845 [Spirochaeta sp. LUC14_002_19_P3]
MPGPTRGLSSRRDTVALLGALCLFLSALEYLVPKPLPFFRLGLSNLPILLGLPFLSPGDLILLLILKVLGQGLINGTLVSHVFLFSLAGSSASLGVMAFVRYVGKDRVSMVGVSLAGAMASSLVQLFLAIVLVFGQSAVVIAPLALGSGWISGLIIGIFAERFARSSQFLAALKSHYRDSPP